MEVLVAELQDEHNLRPCVPFMLHDCQPSCREYRPSFTLMPSGPICGVLRTVSLEIYALRSVMNAAESAS